MKPTQKTEKKTKLVIVRSSLSQIKEEMTPYREAWIDHDIAKAARKERSWYC